ncbi:hypothetical protein HELRODRAFT_185160 [Helobdella robusta]|uniref:Cathepsin L n=1 Tax=Helobdella robusta TaxID=6412 RepID=T1FMG5_HELRO|nr:hypothetical protein HELRODRAFT_185160 [Helobdella robusta]ESN92793.1 hypothetical protein HELRODRAFT_185160 [Helobdella robusta]
MFKLVILSLFSAVLARNIYWQHERDFQEVLDVEVEWMKFKSLHNKVYANEEEEDLRKRIFGMNHRFIIDHNQLHEKGERSFTVGINQFADMTVHEFKETMNGLKINSERVRGSTYLSPNINMTLPTEIDWRKKGLVTQVKNQGHCGSCWAFSATGSLEGQHMRKTGELVELSEQNLVDCSFNYDNNGCNGGLMDNAFKYIKANKGIDTETAYPYEAKSGECRFNENKIGATVTGFVDISKGSEEKLQEVLATVGPVSVAIDAGHESFMFYKSGVYDEPECDGEQLDHGVLAVGYGRIEGKDYYIVKNSWATSWGDKGYVYMSRNKKNQCGIANMASYPLV